MQITVLEKILLVAFALAGSLFISLLLTPVAMRAARKCGVLDHPHSRRVHTRPTPRWGGLAIFAAFALTVCSLFIFIPGMVNSRVAGILLGAFLVTVVGALDDKYNIPAKWKLLGQIACAAILPLFGISFVVVFNIDMNPILGAGLTIIWVVAITNTINLIDGLDGLAAGVSGLAALTFVIIGAGLKNTLGEALLAAAVAGACAGFLRYNFNPARVFMGDAGSHFLGFTIAALSVLQNWKIATGVALAVPMLILAVPIFDTAFAIIRRLRRGQPVFSPDKGHLHHRLLNLGLDQRTVVIAIYVLTAIGCALAILLANLRVWKAF